MSAATYLPSGNIRMLAIWDTVRSQLFPNVPTFKELGYNIEGIIWIGLSAPKGTPKKVIDKNGSPRPVARTRLNWKGKIL
jgi:tripartite-type tricarboxylate transporter receptor subunit TctC